MNRSYAKFLKNEDPEIWLVNAVRSQNLNVQIDSDNGIIRLQKFVKNSQQEQIMQVVKEIIPKTNMLVTNLERVSSK
jgi:translation initiation factor 3 subunit E